MDEFCVRLLSFFERGADGKPGRWPHPALSPENMAGAGFRLQGSQVKSGDNVICDFCKLQAWKWEKKDDPFRQHQDASPKCEYVVSNTFGEHRDVFLKKQRDKENIQRPLTPPATPTKRSYGPRRRMALSPIVTVHESAPTGQATQLSLGQQEQRPRPTEISVTTSEIKFVIQISDLGERGEFCLVFVLGKTRANTGNRQQEGPP
ncbi:baculoviral iap repeat-containing protein 3 [Colletotrichum incanum]|uniref:Baculoviral iap repeat-containing protein 3 n=1 Tax=Colletotrichum incanum TaxID=1573173 RepID=A0A167DWF8_COLIC|nr:baculoviral iap repeat-containing protein 3 [Colletotrichum incanum]OHW97751.1 baculoviral Iap repeat-containing protein 3 [Colletotrichum incanum]